MTVFALFKSQTEHFFVPHVLSAYCNVTEHRVSSQQIRYVAGALALIVAGLHLFHPQHGLERLIILVSADPTLLVTHPRPLAFVLSAIAIVIGIYLVLFGVLEKPIYVLGILLMMTYVVGYFAWHLTGHGGFLPGREPHYHGVAPHEVVVNHLRNDRWALVSVVTETLLAVLFAVLYWRE
ncbi:hypothetical protein SAMN04489842_2381 [Natronobacterium texcoconense]|uniref:Uncharacterized protein n=1 Tax=Natronobacterium texcoconense TaxID=1095778 RepID=A0A1H1GDQ0_NATTX|nr:hypothetical protein SAMN04489842_2381 [Natronobacterium texcoconense]